MDQQQQNVALLNLMGKKSRRDDKPDCEGLGKIKNRFELTTGCLDHCHLDKTFFKALLATLATVQPVFLCLMFPQNVSWTLILGLEVLTLVIGIILDGLFRSFDQKKGSDLVDLSLALEEQAKKWKLEDKQAKVWMNQWPPAKGDYLEDSYDMNETISVLVCLNDNSQLVLLYPEKNLPIRKLYNDPDHDHQVPMRNQTADILELDKCRLGLLPSGLPRSRFWHKRFPIVLWRRSSSKKFDHHIYLFPRTDRDKEEWFLKLADAMAKVNPGYVQDLYPKKAASGGPRLLYYFFFMNAFQTADNEQEAIKQFIGRTPEAEQVANQQVAAINVLVTRLWYALAASNHRLQRSLTDRIRRLRLAKHFKKVEVKNLDMGACQPPLVRGISLPWTDTRGGIWLLADVEMANSGELSYELQTAGLDLYPESKKGSSSSRKQIKNPEEGPFGGDLLDTGSTSSHSSHASENDSEVEEAEQRDFLRYTLRKAPKNYLLKPLVKNRVFRHYFGDKNITVRLSFCDCRGTMVIHLPPPPSDRVWYGFRYPPNYGVKIEPFVGTSNLTMNPLGTIVFPYVFNKMKRKLAQALEKTLVYPNLRNVPITWLESFPAVLQ